MITTAKEKFIQAIWNNDFLLMKESAKDISDFSFINEPNEFDSIPFFNIIRNDEKGDMIQFALELGADPYIMNKDYYSANAIQFAHLRGNEKAKEILRYNEHEELIELMQNRQNRSIEEVAKFIDNGIGVHTRSLTGMTLLMMACRDNDLPLVRFLLERGANPNHIDSDRVTPLMQTFNWGYSLEIADLLVEYGADVHAVSKDGDNVASFASAHKVEALEWCLKHGIDMNVIGHYGFSLLTTAARNADLKSVLFLLELGLDPNHVDEFKKTPLIWAAERSLKMVQAMIKHGADFTLKDKWGNSAKICAEREGKTSIVNYLDKKEKKII